ncbi:hypothetical protein NDU88_005453 [Pleurodeles waltl]|uniref:Uncharacterized protein n=1 Tax=Pleurodeles waltl TaxID=8319 RepID=A0AAV7TVE5_PLEWA|nr:hypothetical protein NDU88_005453 [Pleurodeles waltl]
MQINAVTGQRTAEIRLLQQMAVQQKKEVREKLIVVGSAGRRKGSYPWAKNPSSGVRTPADPQVMKGAGAEATP